MKLCRRLPITALVRRSREGAWIEIVAIVNKQLEVMGRSREGAWIEIINGVSPIGTSGRSREGAWIEMIIQKLSLMLILVAPARERGLKYQSRQDNKARNRSLPRGSVD